MEGHAQDHGVSGACRRGDVVMNLQFWGPRSRFGLLAGLAIAAADQISKNWLLYVIDLPGRGRIPVTPFLDLVLAWNRGISYGLLQQEEAFGRWALLAVKATAVVFLWAWLARTESRLMALALGLIIGGAIGNGVDSLVHGAVADFVLFHITTENVHFSWYVFNLADAAIVAGVAGLLYESFVGERAAKAPRSRP
jgi:signal peptidase II